MSYVPDFQCSDVANYDIYFNICVCVCCFRTILDFYLILQENKSLSKHCIWIQRQRNIQNLWSHGPSLSNTNLTLSQFPVSPLTSSVCFHLLHLFLSSISSSPPSLPLLHLFLSSRSFTLLSVLSQGASVTLWSACIQTRALCISPTNTYIKDWFICLNQIYYES